MIPRTILHRQMLFAVSELHPPEGIVATLLAVRDSCGNWLVAHTFGSGSTSLSKEMPDRVIEQMCSQLGLPVNHCYEVNLEDSGEVVGRIRFYCESLAHLEWVNTRQRQRDLRWAARVLHTAILAEAHERNALYDPLTGIANRRACKAALEREMERSRRSDQDSANVTLFLIDLDNLKQINDAYGHAAGDLALRHVAGTLTANARRIDLPARWAGDEFALLGADISLGQASELAGRILRSVSACRLPFGSVTISIGIATAPRDAGDAETLVRAADCALYEAKAAGRDCIRVYCSDNVGSPFGRPLPIVPHERRPS